MVTTPFRGNDLRDVNTAAVDLYRQVGIAQCVPVYRRPSTTSILLEQCM